MYEDTDEMQSATSSRKGGSRRGGGSREMISSGGEKLTEFLTFLREDWREILAELVSAGVTAYLTYSNEAKSRGRRH